jgi:hypothetical protein
MHLSLLISRLLQLEYPNSGATSAYDMRINVQTSYLPEEASLTVMTQISPQPVNHVPSVTALATMPCTPHHERKSWVHQKEVTINETERGITMTVAPISRPTAWSGSSLTSTSSEQEDGYGGEFEFEQLVC